MVINRSPHRIAVGHPRPRFIAIVSLQGPPVNGKYCWQDSTKLHDCLILSRTVLNARHMDCLADYEIRRGQKTRNTKSFLALAVCSIFSDKALAVGRKTATKIYTFSLAKSIQPVPYENISEFTRSAHARNPALPTETT